MQPKHPSHGRIGIYFLCSVIVLLWYAIFAIDLHAHNSNTYTTTANSNENIINIQPNVCWLEHGNQKQQNEKNNNNKKHDNQAVSNECHLTIWSLHQLKMMLIIKQIKDYFWFKY